MKILIATHNKNKRNEIRALLKGFKGIKVLNLTDLKVQPPIIVEDGKTFRQNAVKKCVTISKFFDGMVLADDSGLEVEALYGRPGVRSARFARAKATDQENVNKLLTLMRRVPEHKRSAAFVCCIALAENGVLLGTYQGDVKGTILYETKGKNGFGYDPVFVPKGYGKTFAEMEGDLKNTISHRGIALGKFKKAIMRMLGSGSAVQQELDLEITPAEKKKEEKDEKIMPEKTAPAKPVKKKVTTAGKKVSVQKKITTVKAKPAVKKEKTSNKPAKKKTSIKKTTSKKKVTAAKKSTGKKKTTATKSATKKKVSVKPKAKRKK